MEKGTSVLAHLNELVVQLHQCRDEQSICNCVVTHSYQSFKCDRILLYRFGADGGTIMGEWAITPWPRITDILHTLPELKEPWEALCRDVGNLDPLPSVLTEFPVNFNQAKDSPKERFWRKIAVASQMIVPIPLDYGNSKEPYGLLIAHQCERSRDWEATEIEYFTHIAVQTSIALNYVWQEHLVHESIAQRDESDRRWQYALEGNGDGVWDWNVATNEVFFSPRWKAMLGFDDHEIANDLQEWECRVHPDDLGPVYQAINDHFEGREPYYISEHRLRCKNNEYKWILDRGQILSKAEDGSPLRMIGTHTDISGQKRTEAALRDREQKYRRIVETSTEGIWIFDSDGHTRFVNRQLAAMLGYQPEAMMGKSFYDFLDPEAIAEAQAYFRRCAQGDPEKQDLRFLRRDGTEFWGLVSSTPAMGIEGPRGESLVMVTDITHHKQAELALQESENRFRNIAQSLPGVIYVLVKGSQGERYFEYMSPGVEAIFEYTPEQIQDNINLYLDTIHPGDRPLYDYLFHRSAKTQTPFYHEWRIITPSKQEKWVQATSRPCLRSDGSMTWYGVILDTSAYKKAQLELVEFKKRLDNLARHIPGMVYQYRLRPDGTVHCPYTSSGLEEIYGVTPDEVKEDATPLFEAIFKEDLPKVHETIAVSAEQLSTWYCDYRIRKPDGSTCWLLGHATPTREKDGSIVWHGYVTDITEYKNLQQALLLAKEQAEAAAQSKSDFLANMSHEIRTPMNGILGMLELISEDTLSLEQQDYLRTIRDSGELLLSIVNDVLDLSKIESGMLVLESRPLDLKKVFHSVCKLLTKQAQDKGLGLSYDFSQEIPTLIMGDASRLRQVFLNVVGNALKFTKAGHVQIQVLPHPGETDSGDRPSGILLVIEDTGIGIECDRLDHLFQPFTQADNSISRQYGGTGLGLSISQKLLDLMGGRIWVESGGHLGGNPPSQWQYRRDLALPGASFFIWIPIHSPTPTHLDPTQDHPDLPHNTTAPGRSPSDLKILLVDDNRTNRRVAMLMLRKLGYQTDTAANGVEALEKTQKQDYDVVLMDVQMPMMDGLEATRHIRARTAAPQPYIIALTAHALEGDAQICRDAGMNDYLTKPLFMDQLALALEKFIQTRPNP